MVTGHVRIVTAKDFMFCAESLDTQHTSVKLCRAGVKQNEDKKLTWGRKERKHDQQEEINGCEMSQLLSGLMISRKPRSH